MSTSEIAPLLSARVPTVTASRFKQYAKKRARSVNEVLSTAIEEWLRQEEFEYIEFRGTVDGTRIAYMKNSRLQVYSVIKVAKLYNLNIEKIVEYWPNRPKEWVQAALNYYEVYKDEIDYQIAESEKEDSFEILKRKFPQMNLVELSK